MEGESEGWTKGGRDYIANEEEETTPRRRRTMLRTTTEEKEDDEKKRACAGERMLLSSFPRLANILYMTVLMLMECSRFKSRWRHLKRLQQKSVTNLSANFLRTKKALFTKNYANKFMALYANTRVWLKYLWLS